MKFLKLVILFGLIFGVPGPSGWAQEAGDTNALLSKIEHSLDTLATVWYPRVVDSVHGGFWSNFDYSWKRQGAQHKMIVSQARHIWTASTLAAHYGISDYQTMAQHGYQFIRDKMWDVENGGFFTLLQPQGDSLTVTSKNKSAYGNSFAIYGLATYYGVSKDTVALDLAKKTFLWLEDHAHDPVHKGYFDVMKQDGSWLLGETENLEAYENYLRRNWKDQNSSIHLLESFTALYKVWPDSLLRKRLEELLVIIRDTITTEKGYLSLHLERDWTPVSLRDSSEIYRKQNFWLDHVSFGHDIETAFLMLEASHALGIENDTLTLRKAKKMVDHALEWCWDAKNGGIYEGGYYWDETGNRTILSKAKVWWSQAEALNSLLLFSELFPKETKYRSLFKKQWEYINTFMIDHKYGGWYHEGLDTHPEAKYDAKAHNWKVSYHNMRALVNVIQMLKGTFPLTRDHDGP